MAATIKVSFTLKVNEDDMPALHAFYGMSSRRQVIERIRADVVKSGQEMIPLNVGVGNEVLAARGAR